MTVFPSVSAIRNLGTIVLSAILLLAACGESAQESDDTANTETPTAKNILRWSSRGDALTFDPHAQNETPTLMALTQVYERLLARSPDMNLVPELAVSYELVEPTLWEFKLRQGVSFHDGRPFTAADVEFSLERALLPTSDFRPLINAITAIEIVDDYTIRLRTDAPSPLLPANMTDIIIMSKGWAEENNVRKPQDFSGGEENYAVRHANGTGPFILELREPDVRTILRKNPDYWGLAEKPHNIDEIHYTPIANDATRVASFLSGELDFLLDPPLQDLPRIRAQSGVTLQQTPQNRTIMLGLNQARDELLYSNIKGRNPFKDVRVRKAIYQAINIDAIKTVTMRGLAAPTGVLAAPEVHGWTEELAKRLPYDPAESRRLLTEAGYPDGFETKLDCPNDRYVNDEEICQALVGMLAQVGITVRLDAQPKSLHFPKVDTRTTDFYLYGWAVATVDSEYIFSFLLVTGQRNNGSEYSNPRMDELAAAMARELDPVKRDAMIAEAWDIYKRDIPMIPLHNQMLVWAQRGGFSMPITSNNQPLFKWGQFEE